MTTKVPQINTDNNIDHRILLNLILVVCIIVAIVHFPSLTSTVLSFDDDEYLVNNHYVQNPSWSSLSIFFSEILKPSTVQGYYQPLTMASLMLDCAFGGAPDNLIPFRCTSLVLHVVNTALIFILLYLISEKIWISAGAGLLFGIHPMTVETIPWVGERKTLLASFFILCSLLCYIKYTRHKKLKTYIGSIILYFLALLSKPTGIMLPLLLIVLDFWPLQRTNLKYIREKAPFFAVMFVFAVITVMSQGQTAGVTFAGGYGPVRIIFVVCHNIMFYLTKIILPLKLSSHYIFPEPLSLSHPAVFYGVIGTFILIPLLLYSLKKTRIIFCGVLFFIIAILPTMQIMRFSNVIASDKFAYLPSFGLLMVITAGLNWLLENSSIVGSRKIRYLYLLIIFLIVASAEIIATRRYLYHWEDTEHYYKYMLKLTPQSAPLYFGLARAFERQGNDSVASAHYRAALELNPSYAEAHNNYGTILANHNKLDLAIKHYKQAIEILPDYAEAYNNLGVALSDKGQSSDALEQYRNAIAIKPRYADAINNIGYQHELQGNYDLALEYYNKALGINPNLKHSHYNIANVLMLEDKCSDAERHYRQAILLDNKYTIALNKTAKDFLTRSDVTNNNAQKAIRIINLALECNDSQHVKATLLITLAEAYASINQYDLCIKILSEAIELVQATQNDSVDINKLREVLHRYKTIMQSND